MTLKIKAATVLKGGLHKQKLSPSLGRQYTWAELNETGGLSGTWAVNQPGRRCATWPRIPLFIELSDHSAYAARKERGDNPA